MDPMLLYVYLELVHHKINMQVAVQMLLYSESNQLSFWNPGS